MTHFLGSSLISWGTKKQNFVALSTAEAEYVAAAAYCSQLLWIRQHLEDFGIHIKAIPLMWDNTSAVSMGKNPVHHKRTKHIDVRHHLKKIGDLVIFYPASDTFYLVGFADADFAGYQVDRKSTSGMTHFLG